MEIKSSRETPMRNDESVYYTVHVQGNLECDWSQWFDGMIIAHSNDGQNRTALSGVLDQTALSGLIIKIRELELTLIGIQVANQQSCTV